VRRLTLVAALAGVVLACTACGSTHKTAVIEGPGPSPYGDGFLIDPPTAAPAFSLIDQTGTKLGAQDQRGHWSIVTFMYTHCPDVCPLIANTLRTAMLKLTDLRVLAVSVDPRNDTPSAVRAFLRKHRVSAKFHYLTGTRAQLAPVWAKYHVASTGGPHATISHSSFEVLIDPKGRERILFDARITAHDVVHDVALLERG
jgi:protein SCO1/2